MMLIRSNGVIASATAASVDVKTLRAADPNDIYQLSAAAVAKNVPSALEAIAASNVIDKINAPTTPAVTTVLVSPSVFWERAHEL